MLRLVAGVLRRLEPKSQGILVLEVGDKFFLRSRELDGEVRVERGEAAHICLEDRDTLQEPCLVEILLLSQQFEFRESLHVCPALGDLLGVGLLQIY